MESPENTITNKHAIEQIKGKQLLCGPNFSLSQVKLKILKTYIKIYLKTRCIWRFKPPAEIYILFNKKLDRSLRLCIDYQGFNNLTIKNWYFLPLISKSLDRLDYAKQFTRLNIISAYHQMRIPEDDK